MQYMCFLRTFAPMCRLIHYNEQSGADSDLNVQLVHSYLQIEEVLSEIKFVKYNCNVEIKAKAR